MATASFQYQSTIAKCQIVVSFNPLPVLPANARIHCPTPQPRPRPGLLTLACFQPLRPPAIIESILTLDPLSPARKHQNASKCTRKIFSRHPRPIARSPRPGTKCDKTWQKHDKSLTKPDISGKNRNGPSLCFTLECREMSHFVAVSQKLPFRAGPLSQPVSACDMLGPIEPPPLANRIPTETIHERL